MKNISCFLFVCFWASPVLSIQVCDEIRLENQCVNRQVCGIVCTAIGGGAGAAAGGSIGAGAGIGAATQICQNVCNNVPECSQISICARSHFEPI